MEGALREPRLPRADPAYPGFEVEVEPPNDPTCPSRTLGRCRRSWSISSLSSRRSSCAILMGLVGVWRLHAAVDGSRLRRRRAANNSAPTEGVKRLRLSQIRSSFPVLTPPTGTRPSGSPSSSGATWSTNTFSEEEARRLYERYHIPAGRVFWGSALANIHPGPDDTHVNYGNPNRAPLLFIRQRGSECRPSIQRLKREAQSGGHDHRGRRVRGPCAPHARPWDDWERGRRLRPRLGGRTHQDTDDGLGRDDAVDHPGAAGTFTRFDSPCSLPPRVVAPSDGSPVASEWGVTQCQ